MMDGVPNWAGCSFEPEQFSSGQWEMLYFLEDLSTNTHLPFLSKINLYDRL